MKNSRQKRERRILSLVLAIALGLVFGVYGTAMAYDGVVGTEASSGYSDATITATNDIITSVTGTASTIKTSGASYTFNEQKDISSSNNYYVLGGYSNATNYTAMSNDITIGSNAVISNNGTSNSYVYAFGGYTYSDAASTTATASGNTITTLGTLNKASANAENYMQSLALCLGGLANSKNGSVNVTENKAHIKGGVLAKYDGSSSKLSLGSNVYGGYGQSASNTTVSRNELTISGGTLAEGTADVGVSACGGGAVVSSKDKGSTLTATAEYNTINISGGVLAKSSGAIASAVVFGGYADARFCALAGGSTLTATAKNNTINISGGVLAKGTGADASAYANVYGGYVYTYVYVSDGSTVTATITNNTINISGTADLTNANLYGYYCEGVAPSHEGNTLNIAEGWTGAVKSIQNFDSVVNNGDLAATGGFTNVADFTNNGTWYPVFTDNASTYTGAKFTLNKNGVINMNYGWVSETERASRTLTFSGTNFTSNDGTFVINTNLDSDTGDKIQIQSITVTGTAKVQVAYDPKAVSTEQSVTGTHTFLTLANNQTITVTGKPYNYSANGKKLIITPTVQNGTGGTEASGTWKITALTVTVAAEADETTKAVSDTASIMNFAWINTINNLQKRMGDLRGGEASNMAWARFQRNNDDLKVGRKEGLSGNLYQVGYDFLIKSNDVANNYFGLSLDVFDGSQSFEIGGGDAKSTTVSAYYTKVYNSGHFFDFIFRYGRFESDTTSYQADVVNPLTKLDYAMNGVTLSGEYGYRWGLSKSGLYLEPQAELIYGYLAGTKATSSTGTLADIDSTNHFVTRLGLAFGQRVKSFNYYLRGSYYHDFAGTTNVKYGDASYKQDSAQNWWEVSLGGGWNLSKASYFYAELTKHFKDISNSLNFNVGFRFTL